MTVLFTEPNCIMFTALYHTFSTSHGIEFTVNDRKIFYGLIPLSFTVCNRINYVFFKRVYILNGRPQSTPSPRNFPRTTHYPPVGKPRGPQRDHRLEPHVMVLPGAKHCDSGGLKAKSWPPTPPQGRAR